MCVAEESPFITLHPNLVLWCLHTDPSAERHLASLPQLNQIYYPNQIKNVVCFLPCGHCLDELDSNW